MVMKLGALFGADFEEYKKSDDEPIKTEANFLRWLDRHTVAVCRPPFPYSELAP